MSKHFRKEEYACKCGCPQPDVNLHLESVLELVRVSFQAPVTITSAYRCPRHNKSVGGAEKSKHLENIAADIQVKGVNPQEVYDFLDEIFPDTYGLGNYDTFTHVDVRFYKARW